MDTALKLQQNATDNNCIKEDLNICVQNAIKKIVKEKGYVRHTINKKILSPEGGNYLGVLYGIDIKGETAEGNKDETNIFVKQVIPNSDNIKIVSVSELYSREIFVYMELANIFTEIQDEAKIPMKNRFKLAKIYKESDIDAIVLENLTKQEFKTYGRLEVMKLDYAKLCVEHLAKFHGLTFLIKRKMPKYYESKIKSLKQLMTFDDQAKQFMNNIYELATKKFNPELKIKTDKWWETAVSDYSKYLQGSMTNVKCLCHGDFKMNNVMYKESEGVLEEVIAVDYQLVHYGSPILDLLFFLYSGTDQKFRRNHLGHLKDHYYDSLKTCLEQYDVLVEDVYPRKEFEKDFKDCVEYVLVPSIWILPLVMSEQEKDLDLGDYETAQAALKFEDSYYDRLQGVFDDVFKWDLY